jgi:sulfofructose kinase
MENSEVLVIGRSCLDCLAVVNRFPRENEKVSITGRFLEGGGQGGTASCCITRLGGRVTYVGKIGEDPEGAFCLERLRAFGVDTTDVEIVPGGRTPVAYLFVTASTGDRTIFYEPSTLPPVAVNARLERLLESAPVVLLDPETTYLGKTFRDRTQRKFKIVYDCERRREGIANLMATADYFIPSMDFIDSEFPQRDGRVMVEALRTLKAQIHGELIVTDGSNGAYYFLDQGLYQIKPPAVQAVDTIGAGDNFHGAFALALSRGFDLEEAVKFSVAVATLSCRDYGGRKGLPGWKEALETAACLEPLPLSLQS